MDQPNSGNADNPANAGNAGSAADGVNAAGDAPGARVDDAAAQDGDDAPASRKRWIAAAVGALAVALFSVPLMQGPDTEPASTSASGSAAAGGSSCTEPEGKANFDFMLKDMNGADVRLADYKGKVVLLNFWATWCGPCKVEIPEFVEVYQQYRGRGFEILGVLAQDDPSRDDLRSFTSAYKMTYPILRTNEEFENAHGPIWALPTSYIIDRSGSICTKHMGPVSRETVEREIKGLL
jgi:cytochrome c biogenesis protein CcmG/thiol:disulfide interchange protein DsbE